ncbi:MAG: site-specific integrase [Ignavibacteriales bacterium]|nr:site-specific integrase [Ignavibacteriales bacterium]
MTKPEVCPKVVFEKKDIITLFNMVEEERDGLKILIYLAFYTGLRPSDLYNINVEDINIGENSLRYYSQKEINLG